MDFIVAPQQGRLNILKHNPQFIINKLVFGLEIFLGLLLIDFSEETQYLCLLILRF